VVICRHQRFLLSQIEAVALAISPASRSDVSTGSALSSFGEGQGGLLFSRKSMKCVMLDPTSRLLLESRDAQVGHSASAASWLK
jgi:hypothetical protein